MFQKLRNSAASKHSSFELTTYAHYPQTEMMNWTLCLMPISNGYPIQFDDRVLSGYIPQNTALKTKKLNQKKRLTLQTCLRYCT